VRRNHTEFTSLVAAVGKYAWTMWKGEISDSLWKF